MRLSGTAIQSSCLGTCLAYARQRANKSSTRANGLPSTVSNTSRYSWICFHMIVPLLRYAAALPIPVTSYSMVSHPGSLRRLLSASPVRIEPIPPLFARFVPTLNRHAGHSVIHLIQALLPISPHNLIRPDSVVQCVWTRRGLSLHSRAVPEHSHLHIDNFFIIALFPSYRATDPIEPSGPGAVLRVFVPSPWNPHQAIC
jgi:hypothetical protein